ncbi:MAG: Double-GTPase 2, partial [Pseudonocardiales bacterium]|nr:Double-GTPase 2 [Pseudonocardiales bacterium]
MTTPPRKEQRVQSRELALTLAASVAGVIALVVSSLAVFHASTTAILASIGIATFAGLYFVAFFLFLQRARRVRRLGARIALTGPRRVGKTVLCNLLYDRLMDTRDDSIEFTADSKSAIATYQAIRGLADDRWPEVSTTGVARQYRGEARFGRRELVEIEIGDTAGEDWIAFSREDGSNDDDSYLEWVLSAQALMHVISIEAILGADRGQLLRRDVQDLKLAARLMRNVQSSRRVPLLLV